MKRSLFGPPDPFSLSPLLSLLPVRGKVGRLEALTSSLFARLEKVRALQREASAESKESQRGLFTEEEMLKEVLEWLAVTPEGEA